MGEMSRSDRGGGENNIVGEREETMADFLPDQLQMPHSMEAEQAVLGRCIAP